jgi:hypothetical protein
LTAVLDDCRIGKKFFNHTFQDADVLGSTIFDRIHLTSSEYLYLISDSLKMFGITKDRAAMLQ